MIWWRSEGERIRVGLTFQWTGGPLLHVMPWSRRWRLRIRWRFYVWSDHDWQIAQRIVNSLDAAGLDHRPLAPQPARHRVWAPAFSCEVVRPA